MPAPRFPLPEGLQRTVGRVFSRRTAEAPAAPPVAEPAAAADVNHVEYVREAGSEGIELVMWLIARGAMDDVAGGPAPRVAHRFYHVPASNTAVGHLILENT